jgi:hypothetical protein
MTKEDFMSKVPSEIHTTAGLLKLKITLDTKYKKSACYLDRSGFPICSVHGDFWDEVYGKLMKELNDKKYTRIRRINRSVFLGLACFTDINLHVPYCLIPFCQPDSLDCKQMSIGQTCFEPESGYTL